MIIKENVKNINLKWIYIITGTFLMAIAYKSIYDSAGMVTGGSLILFLIFLYSYGHTAKKA